MRESWIEEVHQPNSFSKASVRQLRLLRLALDQALNKRDWPLVRRLDRLCAQVTNCVDLGDKQVTLSVVAELQAIKVLYNRSLQAIEKELDSLSEQAY